MKKKIFTLDQMISALCDEINLISNVSSSIHTAGNIKESGSILEEVIRDKIRTFLPDRYLVKQGHIINTKGMVSPQFDIIVFDKLATPRFFESKEGCVFYPIETVLVVGEIKKTFDAKKHFNEFCKKIVFVKKDMERRLIPNTVYNGNVKGATFSDVVNMRTDDMYKNPLYSFILSVDVKSKELNNINIDYKAPYIPDDICILNHGYMAYGDEDRNKKQLTKYKVESNPQINKYLFVKNNPTTNLSHLLSRIIDHLNRSHIEPISISGYLEQEKYHPKDVKFIDINL